MLTEQSTSQLMKISDVKGLDPIHVVTQDYEPGKGQVWISCGSKAWVGYWGAMGLTTVRNFWLICDADYLASNMWPGARISEANKSGLVSIVKAVQAAFMAEKMAKALLPQEQTDSDCSPNHLCGGRNVHFPLGEQCDKFGGAAA